MALGGVAPFVILATHGLLFLGYSFATWWMVLVVAVSEKK
jgi:hypothetical protein